MNASRCVLWSARIPYASCSVEYYIGDWLEIWGLKGKRLDYRIEGEWDDEYYSLFQGQDWPENFGDAVFLLEISAA